MKKQGDSVDDDREGTQHDAEQEQREENGKGKQKDIAPKVQRDDEQEAPKEACFDCRDRRRKCIPVRTYRQSFGLHTILTKC